MPKRSNIKRVEMERDFDIALLQWIKKHKPTELEMIAIFNEQIDIGIKHIRNIK